MSTRLWLPRVARCWRPALRHRTLAISSQLKLLSCVFEKSKGLRAALSMGQAHMQDGCPEICHAYGGVRVFSVSAFAEVAWHGPSTTHEWGCGTVLPGRTPPEPCRRITSSIHRSGHPATTVAHFLTGGLKLIAFPAMPMS